MTKKKSVRVGQLEGTVKLPTSRQKRERCSGYFSLSELAAVIYTFRMYVLDCSEI